MMTSKGVRMLQVQLPSKNLYALCVCSPTDVVVISRKSTPSYLETAGGTPSTHFATGEMLSDNNRSCAHMVIDWGKWFNVPI